MSVTSKDGSTKEERFQRYLKSKPTVLAAIYNQPCIPNTPPKSRSRNLSRIIPPSELIEDGLDAEIDKYSEKTEKMLSQGKLKPAIPYQTKKSEKEERLKRAYLTDFKEKRSPSIAKSRQSDKSKVRFADLEVRRRDFAVGDIIDGADCAKDTGYQPDSDDEESEPLYVPPRTQTYKNLCFKDIKKNKKKQKLRNEEREIFGEDEDDKGIRQR